MYQSFSPFMVEHIRDLQYLRAQFMLISRTDHDISKIAYECGYLVIMH